MAVVPDQRQRIAGRPSRRTIKNSRISAALLSRDLSMAKIGNGARAPNSDVFLQRHIDSYGRRAYFPDWRRFPTSETEFPMLCLFLAIAIPAALVIGFELLLTGSARKNNEPDLYDGLG